MRNAILVVSLVGVVLADRAAHADCRSSLVTTGYTCWSVRTIDITPAQTQGYSNGGTAEENVVYVPDHPAAGKKLVLFLPGTGGSVLGYRDFMAEAAHEGYYVVGLAYRNQIHSPDLCGYWSACAGKLYRQNVDGYDDGFYGHDASAGITPAYNSVTYRFGSVLAWANDGGLGGIDWNVFWNFDAAYSPGPGYWYNGAPAWGHIVIAGHSQGGETAAWITKNKPVIAGLTFEAPYANLDNDHSGDDGNDTTPNGPPHHMQKLGGVWTDVTAWYTPWPTAGGFVCDACFADFLDPSTWPSGRIDKLFITLDSRDGGYDLIGNWPGHFMQGAGLHLGKNETQHVNACPAALSSRFNTTDFDPPTGCSGHTATIVDGCTPSWIRCYWDLMLDRALTM